MQICCPAGSKRIWPWNQLLRSSWICTHQQNVNRSTWKILEPSIRIIVLQKASLSMLGLEFQGRKKRHAIWTAPSCCQQWCCWEAWSRLRGLAVVPGSAAGKVAQPTWWSLCQSVPTWAYSASGLMRLSTNRLCSAKPFHSGTSLRHYHILSWWIELCSSMTWPCRQLLAFCSPACHPECPAAGTHVIQHLHLPNIAWPRQSNNEVKDALFLTLTFIWLTSSSSSSLHRKCQTMHWSNQNITLNPVSNVFWNMTYYEQISSKHIKTLHVCGDTTCHITISQNI